ncbi:MAG: hypothetical protein ACXWXR_02695 [Candidatus Limnocylindrales bacterium]
MSPRASRAVATTVALLALALEAAAGVLGVRDVAAARVALGSNTVSVLILGASFPVVGWLIASRRRENRIGRMFLAAGVVFALVTFSGAYAQYGLVVEPGSLPLPDIAAWLSTLAWVPAYTLLILLLLVFPDGRLPSRRWRPILWIAAASAFLMLVPSAIAEWPYRGLALLTGASVLDPALDTAYLLQGVGSALSLIVAVAGAGALVIRFRRSVGTEHQQIKWFAAAAIAEMAVFLPVSVGVIVLPSPFDALVAMVAAPLIPIAIGVAILRHRLYDIDRIISRTVSYSAVTGILALVFVGTILVSQTVLSGLFRGSSVAVAASTLVVATLFQPLRRRVQGLVDRRFNRSRYDAERTVTAFGARLRDEVDLANLDTEVRDVVAATVAPVNVGLWIRQPDAGS